MLHPKKVGTIQTGDGGKEKQTNEIKIAIPLLDAIDIEGKTITGDALLTQRQLAEYLVVERKADYHFTVKGNQATLLEDLTFHFGQCAEPEFVTIDSGHGRIETRKIWTTTELNDYLKFPYVGQAFAIERERINKKTGAVSSEIAYGVTSCTPEQANAEKVLKTNRNHWCIENSCHYIIDWNFDEDRSRIRTGYGPENMSRLRRFAVGLIKSKGVYSVAQKMRQLAMNPRSVFDYLKMTKNSTGVAALAS
ncbi:MAG: ISAs1 family transposase [Desulfosarcina sp.]|nr:ISAs1 family transposase [Desulfobacterales bacterium]